MNARNPFQPSLCGPARLRTVRATLTPSPREAGQDLPGLTLIGPAWQHDLAPFHTFEIQPRASARPGDTTARWRSLGFLLGGRGTAAGGHSDPPAAAGSWFLRGLLREPATPEGAHSRLEGLEFWSNLPARSKRQVGVCQRVAAEAVGAVLTPSGACLRVLAGGIWGVRGPVCRPDIGLLVVDIDLGPEGTLELPLPAGTHAFVYACHGELSIAEAHIASGQLAVLANDGTAVRTECPTGGRLLLAAARPLTAG